MFSSGHHNICGSIFPVEEVVIRWLLIAPLAHLFSHVIMHCTFPNGRYPLHVPDQKCSRRIRCAACLLFQRSPGTLVSLSERRAEHSANCTQYSVGTKSAKDITGVCYPGVKVQLKPTFLYHIVYVHVLTKQVAQHICCETGYYLKGRG